MKLILEPADLSKSDPSCINTQVPEPNLALPHHGDKHKGEI